MGFSTVAKVAASLVIAGAGFAGGMKAAPVFGLGQVLWSGVIVLCPSGWVMR